MRKGLSLRCSAGAQDEGVKDSTPRSMNRDRLSRERMGINLILVPGKLGKVKQARMPYLSAYGSALGGG